MKKGIGIVLLFVSLAMIGYGSYLEWFEDNENDCCKLEDKENNNESNNQVNLEDSVIIETKKRQYLNSGAAFIDAASIKVNLGFDNGLILTSPTTAYYLPVSNVGSNSCVELEKGGISPFGEWEFAYVIVTLDDNGTRYSYSFTALDKAGYGMKPAREGTPLWSIISINKDNIPVIPKTGDVITSEVLSTETRSGIKAVIATVENGECIVPDI